MDELYRRRFRMSTINGTTVTNFIFKCCLRSETIAGMMWAMSTILEFIQEHLDSRGKTQVEEVAKVTGVPFHTIMKIKRRITTNPKIDTAQKLADHFKKNRKPKIAK